MNGRFFIRDCNGTIVGNTKGYRTIKGAVREQNRPGSKAFKSIWEAYDARPRGSKSFNLVSSVRGA